MDTINILYVLFSVVLISLSLSVASIYLFNSNSENITDSNNHVAMSGVALAYLLSTIIHMSSFWVQVIMIIYVLIFVNLITYLKNNVNIKISILIQIQTGLSGAILAIIYSFPIKIGVDLHSFLFGNIIIIGVKEFIIILITSIILLSYYFLNYKKILLISINKTEAKLRGINTNLFEHIIMSVISILGVVIVQYAGSFLISTTLALPLVTANIFSKSQKDLYINTIMVSIIENASGFLISLVLPVSSSALMVIMQIIGFIFISLYFKFLKKSNINK